MWTATWLMAAGCLSRHGIAIKTLVPGCVSRNPVISI